MNGNNGEEIKKSVFIDEQSSIINENDIYETYVDELGIIHERKVAKIKEESLKRTNEESIKKEN